MREVLRFDGARVGQVWLHQPNGRLHHWHHHDEPEFNLVLRGTATYLLAGRRYVLARNGLVWLFPRQEHLLVDLSPDLALWIGVARPAGLRRAVGGAEAYAGLLDDDPPGDHCRILLPAETAFLDRLCRDLVGGADTVRFNAGLPYLFLAAWDRFVRAEAIGHDTVHPALHRACAALAADPGAGVGALAAAAGVSRFHLARLFRAQLGTTLLAWRTRARVERAMALRRSDERRSWTAIALDCGFGSYAQFHRAFSAVAGLPPRRWRATG